MNESNKHKLFLESNRKCIYCNCTLSENSMTVDHIIPTSQGGSNKIYNKVCACEACNGHKSSLAVNQFIGSQKPGKRRQYYARVEDMFNRGQIDEQKYARLMGKVKNESSIFQRLSLSLFRKHLVGITVNIWINTNKLAI